MATELEATVELEEKVRFVGRGHGEQRVVVDYPPPLGDDAGLRGGLQLLLMALAACLGQTLVPVLAKMRQPVSACRIRARGERREEHPTVLTRIHVLVSLRGQGLTAEAARKALDLVERSFCPVSAMLRPTTPIETEIEILPS